MPYKDSAKNAAAKAEWARRAKEADPIGFAKRNTLRALEYQKRHPERVRAANAAYKLRNPANILVWQARDRARRFGLPCDLNTGDLTIPEFCPVLGIPIERNPGTGKWHANAPSVDRIKPALGYVKGNVRVISWRANNLKRDGTAEEHEAIAAYIRRG